MNKCIARRVAICASLAIVTAMATAVPLKPASAQNSDWNSGQWHHDAYGHQNSDRNWSRTGEQNEGYYRAPYRYYGAQQNYYYQPAPTYYQPQPYYAPGVNLNVTIP
jgi:hypothetical protein